MVVIGSRSHYYYSTETSAEIIEIKHKGTKYKARKDQAYREDYNFFEKLFNDRKCEYHLIFYEQTEEQKKEKIEPTSVRPIDINTKTENKQFITANLLYRVWKYRGVKPAFKDEFKEPSNVNIPTWAIVIVVIVFVVVGGFIAYQSGVLELALSSFNNTKAVNPI